MRSRMRCWATIWMMTFGAGQAIAQTSTNCMETAFGIRCTTTPTPKSGWEQINDTLAQMRQAREERQRQKELQELEKRRAQEEAEIAARRQAVQDRLEQLRLQGEQLLQQQDNQKRAAEALNQQVSQAVLEHRCDDAKTIALTAANLSLADQAMRLCTPLRAALPAHPIGARRPTSSASPTALKQPTLRVPQPLKPDFVATMSEPTGAFPRGPAPANYPGNWITRFDYPPAPLADRIGGAASFKLMISALGRVSACSITVSSGNKDLDDRTCELIASRAGFFPARDVKGRPTAGIYLSSVNWRP